MRRSATPHNPGVSLFPFLAVLICTMGVMMLLLVVCNRPGADDGVEGNSTAAGGVEADLDTAREMISWRISQLDASRQKTEADLADRRLRLSAVEEHMRTLRDQWQTVSRAAKDLEQAEHVKGEAVQLTAAQIAQVKEQVERTKGQVAQAAERVRNEPPSFAIVPYEGPNGTRRRPIYIECGPDRVTLQPEGVVLIVDDFSGPDGPGNPLATILRAVRDYLAASGTAGVPQGEPYPLLIVRPDGIAMFYHARQAMASWASEFGYELIEPDRKLVYPAPIAQLAKIERTALADARGRYAWFAQTRTGRKEAAGTRPVYRASVSGGGIVRVDQGSGIGGQASVDDDGVVATNDAPPIVRGQGSAGGEQLSRTGVGGQGAGGRGAGPGGIGQEIRAGGGLNAPGGGAAQVTAGANPYHAGDNFAGGNSNGSSVAGGGASSGDASAASNAAGYGGSSGSAGADGDGNGAGSGGGGVQGGGGSGAGISAITDVSGDRRVASATAGDRPPTRPPGPGEFVDSQKIDRSKPKPEEDEKKPKSLAETRGRNWSLPSAAKISVPVSRSIQIECRGDQLVILPDTGNPEPKVIPFGPRTEDAVDQLVAGVWSRTKGWGIAGRQMYWRPVLMLHLGPSGEGRCGELQALMANSGLEVTRK
jgi:hypothetical protein